MKAVVLAALILTGCASAPTAPTVQYVDRPVATNCIPSMPARPAYITETLTKSATDLQYGDALAMDWPVSQKYEAVLEAAVRACLLP